MDELVWRIAIELAPGALQYLGEAKGRSFHEACLALAADRPDLNLVFENGEAFLDGQQLVSVNQQGHGRNFR